MFSVAATAKNGVSHNKKGPCDNLFSDCEHVESIDLWQIPGETAIGTVNEKCDENDLFEFRDHSDKIPKRFSSRQPQGAEKLHFLHNHCLRFPKRAEELDQNDGT